MNEKRVLVGSPVYQKPEILEAFLKSLKNLSRHTISIDYMFVDDNVNENSSQLLAEFEREESTVIIRPGNEQGMYLCNDESHHWDDSLMLKVANYKNSIINYAIYNNYDYLFFVDSDLVLHPNLIEHLKTANKDIISEIFWSQWHNHKPLEPNVWLFDEYDLVPSGRFSINTFSFPKAISEFRVKHFGWATQGDRAEKYKRYQLLDPDAIYGIRKQYDSIMDTNANLIKWEVGEAI